MSSEYQHAVAVALEIAYWTARERQAEVALDYARRRLSEVSVGVEALHDSFAELVRGRVKDHE